MLVYYFIDFSLVCTTVVKFFFCECECECESACSARFMGMLRVEFVMGGAGRGVWFHVIKNNYDYGNTFTVIPTPVNYCMLASSISSPIISTIFLWIFQHFPFINMS